MDGKEFVNFDPKTLALPKETLDDVWDCLRPDRQATMPKIMLALRILKAAAQGERNRERLVVAALMDISGRQ
jgi:hypothetical protein